MFEGALSPAGAGVDLAALAPALDRGLSPLLAEATVVEGEPALFILLATQEPEAVLGARVGELVEMKAAVAIKKLDQQAGDAHFRAKVRPAADTMGSTETQVRVPVALLDSMFGRIGQFFSVTTRFNALVFDSEVQDDIAPLTHSYLLHPPHRLPQPH